MQQPAKRYPPDVIRRATPLSAAVLVLLVLGAITQHVIDPTAAQYHQGERGIGTFGGGLNNEFLLLPMLGFREAAAGLLWVRADEFFHSGDYDAILPLVRIITWLDPHADNVYVTGAWHMSYNFTDSAERSDRRYIAPSEALLDEGIRNNMTIPDIKFEKGWENYDKIKDFIEAERDFKMAIATPPMKGSDDYPYGAPLKTLHTLAHTYEKQGRIPEAIDEWNQALARSADEMRTANRNQMFSIKQLRAAEQHNHDITVQRYYDRYTTEHHDPKINPTRYPAILMPAAGDPTPKPWDVAFQPSVEVTRPKVFKISGRFNSADGARINVIISDWDYKPRPIGNAVNTFEPDLSQTILMDSIAVRKGKFEREMDMSKDPKMYGFNEPYYKVILWYDARITSPFLHDRFGWNGEGMTDGNPARVMYDPRTELLGTKLIEGQGGTGPVWDGKTTPWPQDGQPPRLIKVTYKVSLDQVQGLKSINSSDIVPNE